MIEGDSDEVLTDAAVVARLLTRAKLDGMTMDQLSAATTWNRLRVNDALCAFSFHVLGSRREKPKRGRTTTVYFLKEFKASA